MEAIRYAIYYKPIIEWSAIMTKDDVAHMVKMLRGLYPASPYSLDEDLVITTWRASRDLLQYDTADLPAMYKQVMHRHKSFPALPDVLSILRAIKKGPMQKPEPVDMTNYVTTGYGPSMFAGYVEGHAEMNAVLTKLGHKPVQALRYEEFMKLHAPSEQ
jgi:hypothetical protein